MNREELIKKWLDNNLNTEELKAFEQLEDYRDLIQMDGALKSFKAPEFSVENNYNKLKSKLNTQKSTSWLKPLVRVAAVLAICFCVYYYTTTLDSEVNTLIAQQTKVILPDDSVIELNANSKISFNKSSWDSDRIVSLDGEAFFKVEKGQNFDVITKLGVISVLGTQFNVKHREDYFEVICFEGSVKVVSNAIEAILKPGDTFQYVDGKLIANEKEKSVHPDWMRGESNFKNIALKHVIRELQNQYNITISAQNIDVSRSFTGSFTHKNLNLALQSITIPLNLTYTKTDNTIVLRSE
ncbi:MAG: FecR family protein [Winogradskyella sp.]